MRWFDRIRQIKHILIVVALRIVAASLLVSHKLILDMEREEYQRMEIWADAMRALNRADEHTDLGLVLKVINGNNNIPVIVVDGNGRPLLSRNVKLSNKEKADSVESLMKYAAMWKASGNYVRMATDTKDGKRVKSYSDVCYGNSRMLQRLSLYPYGVQAGRAGQGMGGIVQGDGPSARHAHIFAHGLDGGAQRDISRQQSDTGARKRREAPSANSGALLQDRFRAGAPAGGHRGCDRQCGGIYVPSQVQSCGDDTLL